MADDWSEALSALAAAGVTVEMVLHIGAGAGAECDAIRALGAGRIVLVEPDPAFRPGLLARAGDGVEVLDCALAATPGRAAFHVMNMARLSALAPPTGLERLFPGLREVAVREVETCTLSHLLGEPGVARPTGRPVLVIADTPSVTADLVAGLAAMQPGQRPRELMLRLARAAHWSGALAARDALARLVELGYHPVDEDVADPDFPGARLRLDPVAMENKMLREEMRLLREEADRQDGAAYAERAEALQSELDAAKHRIAELEASERELQFRLSAAREELSRAEGQVALIRDLLLSGGER